jgi:hypothetical protein
MISPSLQQAFGFCCNIKVMEVGGQRASALVIAVSTCTVHASKFQQHMECDVTEKGATQ